MSASPYINIHNFCVMAKIQKVRPLNLSLNLGEITL